MAANARNFTCLSRSRRPPSASGTPAWRTRRRNRRGAGRGSARGGERHLHGDTAISASSARDLGGRTVEWGRRRGAPSACQGTRQRAQWTRSNDLLGKGRRLEPMTAEMAGIPRSSRPAPSAPAPLVLVLGRERHGHHVALEQVAAEAGHATADVEHHPRVLPPRDGADGLARQRRVTSLLYIHFLPERSKQTNKPWPGHWPLVMHGTCCRKSM